MGINADGEEVVEAVMCLLGTNLTEPEARLFPDITPEAVSVAFHRLCKGLGITDIRLHDLRNTFATWLRQRRIELTLSPAS